MTKGQQNKPSKDREGHWFRHDRNPIPPTLQRSATMTGEMLKVGINPIPYATIQPPPHTFFDKAAEHYRDSNKFTDHDNRHAHDNHGVYFGNGRDTRLLGRRLAPSETSQHTNSVTKHVIKNERLWPADQLYLSSNRMTYTGQPGDPCPRGRFPKVYKRETEGLQPLTTTTTAEFEPPLVPYTTPTTILRTTQKVQSVKPNPWNYSYHGRVDLYPSYPSNPTVLYNNLLGKRGNFYKNVPPIGSTPTK